MIQALKASWVDEPVHHYDINKAFAEMVDLNPQLKAHRDWTEEKIFGFGERSFLWLHKLLADEMPAEFSFMEIGVFRGAILSLYDLLATKAGKKVTRYGVTPLDSTGDHWESDYKKDIETIHDELNLKKDYTILHGLSTDPEIIKQAQAVGPVDILYIDGGHGLETVQSDIKHYLPMIKSGGYLVIDDCANRFKLPWGFFPGIEPVAQAVAEVLPPFTVNEEYEFQFNVMHNLLWKKK